MAEKSGLFNSVGGVPSYNDIDIAEMFSLLTGGQGYIVGKDNELNVSGGTGLEVLVDTGAAWIGEPNGWWYINNEQKRLSIDAEVEGYSRIDRVILRLDRNTSSLSVTAQILKGNVAASAPVAPDLTQNSMVYELSLAQVHVIGGGTSITVIDERNSVYCGSCNKSNLSFKLSDFGLTDDDFAGKTWEECALIIVNACPASRLVQYYNLSSKYPNVSSALVAEGLPSSGTLKYEAGYATVSSGVPHRFEVDGLEWDSEYHGRHSSEWKGWQRIDSKNIYITDTNFTISPEHANCVLRVNNSSPITITLPKTASVPIPIDTDISVMQYGSAQITFVAEDAEVTIRSLDGNTKTDGRYSMVTLRKFIDSSGISYWWIIGVLTL